MDSREYDRFQSLARGSTKDFEHLSARQRMAAMPPKSAESENGQGFFECI